MTEIMWERLRVGVGEGDGGGGAAEEEEATDIGPYRHHHTSVVQSM